MRETYTISKTAITLAIKAAARTHFYTGQRSCCLPLLTGWHDRRPDRRRGGFANATINRATSSCAQRDHAMWPEGRSGRRQSLVPATPAQHCAHCEGICTGTCQSGIPFPAEHRKLESMSQLSISVCWQVPIARAASARNRRAIS